MKAGTYTGANTLRYRWRKHETPCIDVAYVHECEIVPGKWRESWLAPQDWPAAKAALDALVLSEKVELEKREAQASEVLRDACLEFREAASRRGQVCGPCDECKLQPYWGKGVDALVEQEQEEWVTWRSGEFDYRAKPDGSIVEWAVKERCDWTSWDCPETADAYRKGREVAQQESADLRDAARELVEAVLEARDYNLLSQGEYERVVAAAKKMEGKL